MADDIVQTNIDVTATDRTGQALSSVAQNLRRVNAAASGALAGPLKEGADAAKKAGDAVSHQIGQRAKDSLSGASLAAGAFMEKLSNIPLGMAAAGVAAEEFTRRSFEGFAEVQRGMESIQFGMGATREQIQKLTAQFSEMSETTGRSIAQLQGDFGAFLASSGLGLDDAAKAFKDIGIAATVTGTSLEAMGRAAGSTFSNLRIESEVDRQAVLGAWAKEIPSALMDSWTAVAPRLTQEMATMGFSGKQAAIDMAGMFQQVAASLGSTRLAATSLSEVMAKMSSLSDPLGQVMLPALERIREQGGSSLDAMKALVDELERAGAFTNDLVQRASIRQAFGIDEQTLHSLQVLRDHFADIQKLVNSTGESWQDAEKEFERRSGDAMGAINRLSAAFDDLESQFGALMEQMGASKALEAVADILNDIRATIEAIVNFTSGHPQLGLDELGRAVGNLFAPDLVKGPKAGQYSAAPVTGHHTVPPELLPENVPHFAQGGVVNRPTLAVVGDDGPEAMVPLGGGLGSTAIPKGGKQATEDNTGAINRLTSYLRDWMEHRGSSGLAFTPGAGGAATPAVAGLLPHWSAGGAGGVYEGLGGGGGGGLPMTGSPAPGGVIMPGGGVARGPRVRPEGVVPKEHTPETAAEPAGEPGTYRPVYHLSGADLSDDVVNTIAGEAYTNNQQSVDAVVDNMLNRVGSRGWGPSGNLQQVARAPGQYAGYRRASSAEAAYIRSRIRAIASGQVPDVTHGSNSYRASYYHGPWYQHHADAPVIGGNRFAYDRSIRNGPFAPYATPRGAPHWTVDDINKTLDAHRAMRQEMETPIHTSIAEPKRPPLYTQRNRIATREARWRSEALFEQNRYASQADLGVS